MVMVQNVRKQALLYIFRSMPLLKLNNVKKTQELFVSRTLLTHKIHAYVFFRKMKIVLNDIFNFNRPLVYH